VLSLKSEDGRAAGFRNVAFTLEVIGWAKSKGTTLLQ
jgi:hypothetical protein